jgi:hypothetical protein
MRLFLIFLTVSFFVITASAQEPTRQQKIRQIEELNSQIRALEKNFLAPDASDLKQAQRNFGVFRLLPRERFENRLRISGGGAYYSFSSLSHDYQEKPQISLQNDFLKVGFAGADYGLMRDLGEVSLNNVTPEIEAVRYLLNYSPPTTETEVRQEQRGAASYGINGIYYSDRIPAVVGRTYVLRAINFDKSDILVALKIHRKDSDGSLIIFWKYLEQFPVPSFNRSEKNPPPNAAELEEKVLNALQAKGFYNVTVDVSSVPFTLRGTVPKGKLAEAVMTVQEILKKPVRNEMTEQ